MTEPIGSLERDRWRAAFAATRGVLEGGSRCPPAEKLWASAHEELHGPENEDLILHLARCPACAEGWRLARAVREEPPAEPAGPGPGRRTRFRLPTLLAAAAVLLLGAVGVGLRFGWLAETPPAAYRSPAEWRIASEIPEDAPLPRDDCVLRWTAGPPGTTYDVRVGTGSLEPILEVRNIRDNELRIEPARLRDLPPETILLWRVTAHLPDGASFSSPTFRTRLGPPE
ncbi:MAG: hypothetical protein Kow0062_19380 [Acidobacteriota bacterium]